MPRVLGVRDREIVQLGDEARAVALPVRHLATCAALPCTHARFVYLPSDDTYRCAACDEPFTSHYLETACPDLHARSTLEMVACDREGRRRREVLFGSSPAPDIPRARALHGAPSSWLGRILLWSTRLW